jgi:FkbM family methyltransferase
MYYSQQGEDSFLHQNYLNYTDGFFIELGAMDGVLYSNSLFFERNLNWSGVLIEPTRQFDQLMNNRPNCYNFNYAVSEDEGQVEFLGDGALGGVKTLLPEQHIKGWNLDINNSYLVESKPIHKILESIDIKRVDLFSIDVEGGELEVLKTFNWEIPVYIVLIEISKYDEKKDQQCKDFLKSKGFVFESNIGCNEVWINKKNIA